jgi:hypothetical protein
MASDNSGRDTAERVGSSTPNPNAVGAAGSTWAGYPFKRRTQCNFCGRPTDAAGPMMEGPGDVYICEDCVEMAYGLVLEARARRRVWPDPNHPAHRR